MRLFQFAAQRNIQTQLFMRIRSYTADSKHVLGRKQIAMSPFWLFVIFPGSAPVRPIHTQENASFALGTVCQSIRQTSDGDVPPFAETAPPTCLGNVWAQRLQLPRDVTLPSTSLRLFPNHPNFLRLNIGHQAAKASTDSTSRSFRFWSENTNGSLVPFPLPTAFCVTGGVCRGFRLAWEDLVVLIPPCKDRGNFPVHDRVLEVMQTPPDNKKGVHFTETGDGRGNEGGILGPQWAEPLFYSSPEISNDD